MRGQSSGWALMGVLSHWRHLMATTARILKRLLFWALAAAFTEQHKKWRRHQVMARFFKIDVNNLCHSKLPGSPPARAYFSGHRRSLAWPLLAMLRSLISG